MRNCSEIISPPRSANDRIKRKLNMELKCVDLFAGIGAWKQAVS
jgi:hypothetical protein